MQLSAMAFFFSLLSAQPTVTSHEDSARVLIAQSCHASYEGECVPITSDADCASGSGNGPAYVQGPVRVVGPDEYGLDRDGDGVACEN